MMVIMAAAMAIIIIVIVAVGVGLLQSCYPANSIQAIQGFSNPFV